MIKVIRLWALLVFIVGLSACAPGHAAQDSKAAPTAASTVYVQTADGSKIMFHVELAVTGSEQQKGLMGRESMEDNAGMLFLFESTGRRSFWMKDTLIPLDMLFLAPDGEIRHIHHMAQPLNESRITAIEPFKGVLEINGGMAAKLGIKEGDHVLHDAFRNVLAQ
ncbi:MAG: DUF192 domain-containing protein [Alphaproteobacteria bacterium]